MHAAPLHLDPGSDVRRSLEQLAHHQGASGFVLSVVGNLSQASFQCPGQARPTVLKGAFEIITLQGTVAPDGVHLHLSFSDPQCQVWGGHLEPGTLVDKGADLLVGFLDEPSRPAAASVAMAPRVSIAVAPGCPFSRRALRMLRTLGIAHQLIDPVPGASVPQVHIDGVLIGGYDALAEMHASGQLDQLR